MICARKVLCFFLPLCFLRCGPGERTEADPGPTDNSDSIESADSLEGRGATGSGAPSEDRSERERDSVSEAFLGLVEHIASSGFICDPREGLDSFRFDKKGHAFYKLPFESSVKMMGAAEGRLDRDLMGQVERITAHFHIHGSVNEENAGPYHPDGVVEEWRFPDAAIAQRAAEHMARDGSRIYFNRGVYVAVMEDQLYLFHSRASRFYTHLEKFWTWFAEREGAERPMSSEQRKMY